jgi:hypothetical protein
MDKKGTHMYNFEEKITFQLKCVIVIFAEAEGYANLASIF